MDNALQSTEATYTPRRRMTGRRWLLLSAIKRRGTAAPLEGITKEELGHLLYLGWVEDAGDGQVRVTTEGEHELHEATPLYGARAGSASGRNRRTAPRAPTPALLVQLLSPAARVPSRAHEDDAGWDLYVSEQRTVQPGAWCDVPCGIAIAVPPGYFTRITGRSSTFRKRGLLTVEGIIDAGFRGELFACVYNTRSEPVTIEPGERLAQLLIARVESLPAALATCLPDSARGTNGFGSSGT